VSCTLNWDEINGRELFGDDEWAKIRILFAGADRIVQLDFDEHLPEAASHGIGAFTENSGI
jgi:hypothetical protein